LLLRTVLLKALSHGVNAVGADGETGCEDAYRQDGGVGFLAINHIGQILNAVAAATAIGQIASAAGARAQIVQGKMPLARMPIARAPNHGPSADPKGKRAIEPMPTLTAAVGAPLNIVTPVWMADCTPAIPIILEYLMSFVLVSLNPSNLVMGGALYSKMVTRLRISSGGGSGKVFSLSDRLM
jgi:hypothetical protein